MDPIKSSIDRLLPFWNAANEALSEWSEPTNLQFPALMGMIALKLNLDKKQIREIDPLVRFFIRSHPEWYVTRGAHGGIMRVSDRDAKETARLTKARVKSEVEAMVAAKVAMATLKPIEISSSDSDESDEDYDIDDDLDGDMEV